MTATPLPNGTEGITPAEVPAEIPTPLPGSLELRRINAAIAAGRTPDKADIEAVRRLRPPGGMSETEVLQLIEALHSDSSEIARQAWTQVSQLIRYRSWNEQTKWDFQAPDREWLIKDWLPLGRIGLLTGEGEKEIYLDKSQKTHWIWRVAAEQPQQQTINNPLDYQENDDYDEVG